MGLRRDVGEVARAWRWGRRPLPPASVDDGGNGERLFPTAWARSAPARGARAAVQRLGLAPLLRVEVRASVHGLDVLDDIEPPVIFVANHSSHLDAPLILTSLPRRWRTRMAVGAAADYFFDSWWRGAATALVFNAFPVERKGARRAARGARELLREGWNLLVFPQGTRSHDGWVTEFRPGAAWLALDGEFPVVPIAVSGTYQAMPRGKAWPAAGRPPVRLRLGRPLRARPGERGRDLNERIRRGLAATMHEDGTTWWEAISRAARGDLPDPAGPDAARWRRVWEASRPLSDPGGRRLWGRGDRST